MPSNVARELGIAFETKKLLEAYDRHPEVLIDHLARGENLWSGVMPNAAPWNSTYDKGFFGVVGGMGLDSIDPKEQWSRSSSPSFPVWRALQISIKGGLQWPPAGAVGVSVLSDLVALDKEQRAKWGAQLLAHTPGTAADTAYRIASMRVVMREFEQVYPDPRVRDGAKAWADGVDEQFESLGIPRADEATPQQLAELAPTPDLKQLVLDATKNVAGGLVTKEEFDEKLKAISLDVNDTLQGLSTALEPILQFVDEARGQAEAKLFTGAVAGAKAWATLGGQLLAIAGNPLLGSQFTGTLTAGIELTSSCMLLDKSFSAAGKINPMDLTNGVGAALALYSLFQEQGPTADEVIIGMLTKVLDKLGEIQKQLRDTHLLVADLYSFVTSFRTDITSAVAQVSADVQALTLLYGDVERAALYAQLNQDTQLALVANTPDQDIEYQLTKIATAAIAKGSSRLHTHGPGIPYSTQYTKAISDIFRVPHAEGFAGVLADSAADLAALYKWLKIDWVPDPDETSVPEKERMGELKEQGNVIGPSLVTGALSRFRKVFDAHPEHLPPSNAGRRQITSLDQYRLLIRSAVWVHRLYLETNTLEVVQAALLHVHVLYSELSNSILRAHQSYIAGKNATPYTHQLPVDILFGQEPYLSTDWVTYTFRRLQTMYRMGLVEENYLHNETVGPPWAVCRWKLKTTGQVVASFSALAPLAGTQQYAVWGCAAALASIVEGQDVVARLREILGDRQATFTGIRWFEPGIGNDYREYEDWTPEAQGDPAFEASLHPAIAVEARKWATESASAAFAASHMQDKIDELKRACVQASVIFKNAFPVGTRDALPPALATMIDQAGNGFGLPGDASAFFGQDFLSKFNAPILQGAQRAPGPPVTTSYYDVRTLISDGAPSSTETLEERQHRWKTVADSLGPQTTAGFGSATSQNSLDVELSYHVSQALPLTCLVPPIPGQP